MAWSNERAYQLLHMHRLLGEMTSTLAAMRRGAQLNLKSWEHSSVGLPTVAHGLASLLVATEELYCLLCSMPDVDGEPRRGQVNRSSKPSMKSSGRLKTVGDGLQEGEPDGVICLRRRGCLNSRHCEQLSECVYGE